jgi:hypothetical protein
MRRVDILKMQLLNSRGRFFTAEWKGVTGCLVRTNLKVSKIEEVGTTYVKALCYIPMFNSSFPIRFQVDKNGDCKYIAADKSTIQLSGWVS